MRITKIFREKPRVEAASGEAPLIKYPKPKVLLLDVAEFDAYALIDAGFNVNVGTLGTPYKVPKIDGYLPVIGQANLPNHTEQEIIVVDLHIDNIDEGSVGPKHRPDGEIDIWAKCNRGFIDPRPRAAAENNRYFDRILNSGGIFIVFADARTGIELKSARKYGWQGGGLYDENPFPFDVWSFVSELSDITVSNDHGSEMNAKCKSALGRLVGEHLDGGQFLCSLKGGYRERDPWVTLVENKFANSVGICRCRGKSGTVIILPQIIEKGRFLRKLFSNVLPEIAPHLFPHLEQGKWTHHDDYELPRVRELKAMQALIEQRAKEEIESIEIQLADERTTNGWLHDMLTGTDTLLVEAVKRALAVLGFIKVVDIDEERDREGQSRREDLQVCDQSPTLVVDVKGIGGFPSDEDALQADKHAAIRMREQKRTDIIGLSIINHQRHLPPLDRENAMPFRQELLDAGEERSLGLITSFDLYRLVLNFGRFGWRPEDVRPLFYRKGRVDTVPLHYKFIGTIERVWTDKFGIVIGETELQVGDRVAIEFPINFEEIEVDSIQVNDKSKQCAEVGDPAGILWPPERPKLREGMRVFRVAAFT